MTIREVAHLAGCATQTAYVRMGQLGLEFAEKAYWVGRTCYPGRLSSEDAAILVESLRAGVAPSEDGLVYVVPEGVQCVCGEPLKPGSRSWFCSKACLDSVIRPVAEALLSGVLKGGAR